DNATGLVLCDRGRSRFLHLGQALGTIVTHSGHDHANRFRTNGNSDRAKKYIDAWPVARNQRSIEDLNDKARTVATNEHVPVARSNQCVSILQPVAVRSFLDGDFTLFVQTVR